MSKDKKGKNRKSARQPAFQNDQLGENATAHFSEQYDNKQNKRKK